MALNIAGLPTTNLEPGSSGNDVKALQNWLIKNGFSIPAGASGYYGDQTKAAVAQLQQNLGVNAGQNMGYFGPLTISAVQKAVSPSSQKYGELPPGTGVPQTGTALTTPAMIGGAPSQPKTPAASQAPTGVVQYSSPAGPPRPEAAAGVGTYGGVGGNAGAGGGTSTGSGSSTTNAPVSLDQDAIAGLKFLTGWTDEQVNAYITSNPQDALNWAMIGEYMYRQNAIGASNQSASAEAIKEAYDAAIKDPNISAKYADMYKLDTQSFGQQLTQITTGASIDQQQTQLQFENERKALAEQYAAAGAAYSGYRAQAQQNLGTTESGIVQSKRSQIQKQLNDLTTSFESKYGTSLTPGTGSISYDPMGLARYGISGQDVASPGVTAPGLTGEMAGGITGTVEGSKQADIASRASQIQTGILPPQ